MTSKEFKKLENDVADAKDELIEKKAQPRVTEKTLKQYLVRVKKIHSLMYGKPMEGIEWMKDYKKVVDFILKCETWKTQQTKGTYINSITSYLRNSKELPDVYKEYSDINKVFATNTQNKQKDNTMNDKQAGVMLPWTEIIDRVNTITNTEDKSLVGLYTLFPPRRIDDYRLMKIFVKKKGRVVPEDDFNYLVLNSRKGAVEFVFNKYKTAKHYGQQVFSVPAPLKAVLKDYVVKMKNDDFLFSQNKNNKPLSQSGFTSKVRNIFKKHTGKPLTVNSLRHSYISGLPSKISVNDRETIAKKMAHSVGKQMEYNKIDLE